MTDWIGDPSLSAEEKLARFEALHPEPTRGPARDVAQMPAVVHMTFQNMASGGEFKTKPVRAFNSTEFNRPTMPGAVPAGR